MEKPFTIGILREITDLYESGDISYAKMVEMLNEISIKWHEQITQANDYKMKSTQTAVEWLMLEMLKPDMYKIWPTLLQRAKQMEKQQLANTWDAACDSYILLEGNLVKVWKDFDKYYNETYQQNKG